MSKFIDDACGKIEYVQDKLNYLTINEINKYLNSAMGDILAVKQEIRELKTKGDDK